MNTLSQGSLPNEAHFQHKTETRDILNRYPSVIDQLGVLHPEFARLYEEEDVALKYINKSDFTKMIGEKDRERDETTMGLYRHIDADCYHYTPELRIEAISLQNIKNRFRDIIWQSIDMQTAATHNLLQELNAKRDILEHFNLTGWVDQLEVYNTEVNELMKSRDAEKAVQPVERMKKVRPHFDRVTNEIYGALDTFALVNPSEELSRCIDELNAVNKRYADNLAQSAGQRAAAKMKKKAAEENSGSE